MFKKYIAVAAVCVIGALGGITTQTAEASASFGGSNGGEKQPIQTETQTQHNQAAELEEFLEKYFSNWNVDWNEAPTEEDQLDQEPTEEVEQPTQESADDVEQTDSDQQAPHPEVDEQEKNDDQDSQANELSQFEQEVVTLTNQEREKQGLSALKVDKELSKVARDKSKDMQENNYFDHNSPTYGSPFDMMQSYDIDYQAAGENIARGQRSPEEVVDGWMNSEGHRANILNESFTHIGVGYVEQGNYWTQQFIGK